MRFKYLFFPVLFVAIQAYLSSCKKYVEVDAPINQLATTSVFNDNSSAIAAQLAVYTQMNAGPATLDRITALSSDEITPFATDVLTRDLYRNSLNATADAAGIVVWTNAYKYIYEENAILENIQKPAGITANVKALLTGEAKFMRGFWYFYLVNLYGDVPLVLSTDYTLNSTMAKSNKDIIYRQVINDLVDSRGLLSTQYLDGTDTAVTLDRVRPTTWAASALLARCYLYNQKYDSAEQQATVILSNTTLFNLLPNLDDVFKKNSLEAIWQIQPTNNTGATAEGSTFFLNAIPASATSSITVSPRLLAAFDSGDKRRSSWVGTFTSGTNSWYFLNKYKYKTSPGSTYEYSMVLRLAEQYLIRAEARARQNKLSDAISDLNKVRIRAGLAGVDPSLNQHQIIDAIIHERQVELFGEAHRWLDLKRWDTIDSVMKNATPLKGGAAWNSYQQLYPIPVIDIQRNYNLVQNQSY